MKLMSRQRKDNEWRYATYFPKPIGDKLRNGEVLKVVAKIVVTAD